MPILAIDTSTLVSSVALATGEKVVAELTLHTRKTHSERLMPHIGELLAMAEVGKQDITAVAVSIGPGSFTGLRIGLATAKALAYALGIPLVGVPTLAALAYGCPVSGTLLAPTMDAQKGNLYSALYRWHLGMLREVASPLVSGHDELAAELAGHGEPCVILGEGAALFAASFRSAGLALGEPHVVMPRAANVAALGLKMLEQGISHDLMALEPFYIRRSEAEELWEKRHNTCG